MKICVSQTEPIKGDVQKNIEKHIKMINLAISKEAGLIIFPELSLTGYEPKLAHKLATNKDDVRFDRFQEISTANQIIIGVGIPIHGNSGVYIGMLLFHPNRERQVYLKHYLYVTEEAFFISGQNTTNLIEGESIAVAICYELSVPEHSKQAFENGANMYIASVVESVEGIEKSIEKLAKIASKHGAHVLVSNCVGKTGIYNCGGKTSIWNKNGQLVGQLSKSKEGVLMLDTVSNVVKSLNYN